MSQEWTVRTENQITQNWIKRETNKGNYQKIKKLTYFVNNVIDVYFFGY